MANPTCGVVDIPLVAGDDMNMEVVNGLSSCFAGVETDVETIGAESGDELALHLIDKVKQSDFLSGCGIPLGREYPIGDHEGVPVCDRVLVADSEGQIVGSDLRVRRHRRED